MTFEHKFSTRHPIYWVIAPTAIFFGVPIALGFGILIMNNGIEFGPLLALAVGLAFSAAGLSCLYRIIFPKEYTTIISNEMIICKTNNDITYQVKKEDIEMITISEGDIDSVFIEMKSSERIRFPFTSWVNLSTFREELVMCEYPVD